MKFKKPKFWDYNKPNILSYLFLPVSLLLTILKSFKNLTTKKKKYSKIKTICVGNIYLGGTGKTSLSLKINEILTDKIKTCFIKKGGQNPLEPARFGAKILHGPNIDNFRDVYKYLNQLKISSSINSPQQLSLIHI